MSSNNGDDEMSSSRRVIKPKMIMDDEEEEVTRKIAPAMVMPSLRPLPAAPIMHATPTFHTSSINTTYSKIPKAKSTSPFSWKLSSVPVLPEFHPLEKTATFVPNAMPSQIASRISDILRERSIEAKYESGKAKVKCKTAEGVDFRIRLYRGRGRYNHGIIVEVQRRFGTSIAFYNDTQAILRGAKGEMPAAPKPLSRENILPQATETEENNDVDSAVSSLAMISKMMKLSGFDSQYLGLQMLSPLVDSERLSSKTAEAVASRLFQHEVGEKVLDYIVRNSKKERPRSSKRGALDDYEEDESDSRMILRNTSLNILANATKACGKVPELGRDALRTALLRDLRDAENHPNTAFLAAKCLEHFIREDYDNTELQAAFQVAHTVGEARHVNLMHQARKCMRLNSAIVR